MDEYFRMISKANEIQDMWQPQRADTCYIEDSNGNVQTIFIKEPTIKEDFITAQNRVWIPRQEDYQEIILTHQTLERKIEDWTPWVLIQKLYMYMNEPQIKWNSNINLNQMYLELTMETVYNKKWDNKTKKWVLIE
jgi:hypothetical protein